MSEKDTIDAQLEKLSRWQAESKNLTTSYITRWAKNDKLWKGIFQSDVDNRSKVRGVEKTFFRKIWATGWRLLASFYNAYLRDYDNFIIEGRDTELDPRYAKVLHFMTQYHRDRMLRQENLFLRHIWAFQNIIKFGLCVGKFYWNVKKDKPDWCLYPNDQTFLDLGADDVAKMRYCFFLNYMTKEEMEEEGYKNIDELAIGNVENNELRSTRFNDNPDPIQDAGNSNYSSWTSGGRLGGVYSNKYTDPRDRNIQRYRVYECFWKENGKIMYGVSGDFKIWLMEPIESPYGERFPVVVGTCLTEPHKIIGEGFPEPLASPQESFNYFLNIRKDNVAMSMTGHTFVSRYGNVDLQSLVNRRTGGYTLVDDVNNSVRHEQMPDVTRTAYNEAGMDASMMDEMSGITPGKIGMETSSKATVAQINFNESNAKVDLYIAIVGETFMRDWTSMLAYLIAKFETDITVFKIANDKLQKEMPKNNEFIYQIDIDADCIINVGSGTAGRDMEIKQILLAMDRAMMSNQATGALLQMGVVNPQNALFINTAKFMEDLLPKIGKKNLKDYFIQAQPAINPETGMPMGGGGMTPQVGDMTLPADANMIQEGSMGGI